jgi:hypothetical protein
MSAWAVSGQAEDLLRKDGVEGSFLGTKNGSTFLTCHKQSIDLDKIGKHVIVTTDEKCAKGGVIDSVQENDAREAERRIYQRMIEKAVSEARIE